MTPGEWRRAAKCAIDRARRERVAREDSGLHFNDAGEPLCLYCAKPFAPRQPNQRFCSDTHRKNHWAKTDRGQQVWRENRQRRNARKRGERSGLTSTSQAA